MKIFISDNKIEIILNSNNEGNKNTQERIEEIVVALEKKKGIKIKFADSKIEIYL